MRTLSLSIDFGALREKAKKSLSSYGKRRKDNQGNTLFAELTMSSAENSKLDDFVWKGVEIFLGEMSPIVSGSNDGDTVIVTFHSNRVNETKQQAFEMNMQSFVVEYVLVKALDFSGFIEEKKEAESDMQRHLNAAVKLIFTSDAPEQGDKNLSDMTGEVIFDNKPVVLNK